MAARSALVCTALVAAVGVLCESGAAADPTGASRISYEAPADCPTEAQFLEALRLDGMPLVDAPRTATDPQFRVRIAQGAVVRGQVVASDGGGREVSRTIVGARCDDVVRALAVTISLLAESLATAGNSSLASSTTHDPDAAAAAPPPSVASPTLPPSSAPATAATRVAAPPAPAERSTILEPLPPGWRVGVAAEGTVNGLGSAGLGLAAYLEVIRDVPDGFAPALRLGVEFVRSTASVATNVPSQFAGALTASSNETASLTRRVVRFDACPVRAVAARPWSPSPIEAWACARLDAGVLDAIALNLPNARDMQRAWVAVGGLAHLRWVVSRVFLDLEGGITFPVVREQFYVEPSTLVYRVPVVTGAGGLALGAYFL
jgi:hypothetical protein